MFDLASMFNPQAQPSVSDGQPATQQDGWDAFLSNPATRAALLSFGLNTLAGGWGSPVQNLAQAAGAGLETGGAVGASEEAQAEKDAAIARQQQRFTEEDALKREEMANRTNIARIAADTRITTAGIRAASPRNAVENKMYWDTYNKSLVGLQNNALVSGQTPEQIQAVAKANADAALEAYQVRFPGGGTAPDAGGGAPGTNLAAPQGGGAPAGTVGQENSPGVAPSQMNRPLTPSRPTATGRDGKRYILSPDGKSWQPM